MTQLEKPTFKDGESFIVAGLRHRFDGHTVKDIPALWQRMGPYFDSLPEQVGRSAYGLVIDLSDSRQFDYVAGIEVSSAVNLPNELISISIPAQHYAAFPHREHVTKLKDTMTAVWREWLPSSGYQLRRDSTDSPGMIEYYGPKFDPKTGIGDVEVWVPVKKSF
jgi:AraC family transcriptional regulator